MYLYFVYINILYLSSASELRFYYESENFYKMILLKKNIDFDSKIKI